MACSVAWLALELALRPAPLGVLLLDVGIEHGVLERDGRLRGEQLEHGEPPGGERAGHEPVLQVEQRRAAAPAARSGAGTAPISALAAEILVFRGTGACPAASSSSTRSWLRTDIVENGLRQRVRRGLARVEQRARRPWTRRSPPRSTARSSRTRSTYPSPAPACSTTMRRSISSRRGSLSSRGDALGRP